MTKQPHELIAAMPNGLPYRIERQSAGPDGMETYRIVMIDEPPAPPKKSRAWIGRAGTLGTLAFKLFKSAKAVKAALAVSTLGSFAWMWTWEFAIIMIVALMIHEYGHCWAMRRVGIPTKGFYLIPFMGGAAVPERGFETRYEEAFVAIMGPVWGFIPAAMLAVGYLATGIPMLGGGAVLVSLVNLINFLPVMPLDGGRMLRAITFCIITFLLGIVGALYLCFTLQSVMFGALLIAASLEFAIEWKNGRNVTRMTRWQTFMTVLATAAVMGAFLLIILGMGKAPGVEVAIAFLTAE